MKNKWKLLFISLVSINIVAVGMILLFISLPVKNSPINTNKDIDKANSRISFVIQTNKQDLNNVINHHLQKQNKWPIEFQVILDENINLYGVLPIFDQELEMKMVFEAQTLATGDLILKEKELSLGRMELPASYVLKFIEDHYEFPEWISIQPNDELIYVNLQNMKLKSDLKIAVNEINLEKDEIIFTLLVPVR